MKKTVKIEMYLDCTNEFGVRRWCYVTSVWGNELEFLGGRWFLRDSDKRLICCGNISELHGAGSDQYDVKFKNVVCY